jgi:hypothetical protein
VHGLRSKTGPFHGSKDAKFAAAMNDNKFFARLRDFEDLKRWIEDDFSNENELVSYQARSL